MNSLTLHALDDQLAAQIRRQAKELSISMNELAKRILAEGLGIKVPAEPAHRVAFASFCGSWAESDAKDFNRRVTDMATADPEDWK